MESNVSNLSYESFKTDLQNEACKTDESPKVVNSTMIVKATSGAAAAGENLRGNLNKDDNATATGKRKLIRVPLPYRCRECVEEFGELRSLRAHFILHLSGRRFDGKENEKPPYFCRHKGCSQDFINQDDRKNHEIRHVTKGKSNCERIQKLFKYK